MTNIQHTILRIVAQSGKITSRELIHVATKLGKSSTSIRSTANRLVMSQVLVKTGRGKGDLSYQIGPKGKIIIERSINKAIRWFEYSEGLHHWDGSWFVVSFTIPERERVSRDAFRSRLVELGFGLLSPGVWVHPFRMDTEVRSLARELDIEGNVIFLSCGEIIIPGTLSIREMATRIWGLDGLRKRYQTVIKSIDNLMPKAQNVINGKKADAEGVFFEALNIQDDLTHIITDEDPCLPPELLPEDGWPTKRAYELFHELALLMGKLAPAQAEYDYFFHFLDGMEAFMSSNMESDLPFHWPTDEERNR
jgi:phenylacetic acid degradation operon negative regulatory protein